MSVSDWFGRQSAEDNGNWDDSVLSKEEVDERTKKKVEAIVKRERAMAYAYSHQVRTVEALGGLVTTKDKSVLM